MLKAEQNLRIAMRDHLLYANLGVVGAVSYFALSDHGSIHSLLVVPWACFILGWTYLSNDAKVSEIREYVSMNLAKRFAAEGSQELPFAWERTHRLGRHRTRFKLIQLAVDLITFVFSSIVAMYAYCTSAPALRPWHYVAVALASAAALALAIEFIRHFIIDTRDLHQETPKTTSSPSPA